MAQDHITEEEKEENFRIELLAMSKKPRTSDTPRCDWEALLLYGIAAYLIPVTYLNYKHIFDASNIPGEAELFIRTGYRVDEDEICFLPDSRNVPTEHSFDEIIIKRAWEILDSRYYFIRTTNKSHILEGKEDEMSSPAELLADIIGGDFYGTIRDSQVLNIKKLDDREIKEIQELGSKLGNAVKGISQSKVNLEDYEVLLMPIDEFYKLPEATKRLRSTLGGADFQCLGHLVQKDEHYFHNMRNFGPTCSLSLENTLKKVSEKTSIKIGVGMQLPEEVKNMINEKYPSDR